MKKILLLPLFICSVLIGIGQTTLIEYDNDVNTQYKIKCTWEANGITYSTGGPGYEMIQGNSSGTVEVTESNAQLLEVSVKIADCAGSWITFTAGTQNGSPIEECSQCPGNDAAVDYDGNVGLNNTPGYILFKCRK